VTTFLRYAIDASLVFLAVFGIVEVGIFLAAAFIAPTEYDWDDEREA
jgi:hypothetical protein